MSLTKMVAFQAGGGVEEGSWVLSLSTGLNLGDMGAPSFLGDWEECLFFLDCHGPAKDEGLCYHRRLRTDFFFFFLG